MSDCYESTFLGQAVNNRQDSGNLLDVGSCSITDRVPWAPWDRYRLQQAVRSMARGFVASAQDAL